MEWDLSDLYKSIRDPQIDKDKKWITSKSILFTKQYKGKINSKSLNEKLLINALKELEQIEVKSNHLAAYAHLLQAKATQDAKISSFFQDITEFLTTVTTQLTWFSLEWKAVSDGTAKKLLNAPALDRHKHHLQVTRLFTPFTLSEKEEILITKMDQSGSSAFTRLYDELLAREQFTITARGKRSTYSVSTISPILTNNPNRKTRIEAASAYTKTLSTNAKTYSFILNTKLLDKKTRDEVRSFKNATEATLIQYEIPEEVVVALQRAVTSRFSICERFYLAKSKLLKHKLNEVDRYSAVSSEKVTRQSFAQAQALVLESLAEFSPKFSSIASQFFVNKWIDATPTHGKQSGAFCAYVTPDKHPYILMNFTGETRDTETLAHELGHAIHAKLANNNNFFDFHPSTATAEIASIFCESIIFEKLYQKAKTKKQKINLLANKLQSTMATVFRQMAFFNFESELNTLRRSKGELSVNQINSLYQKHLQQMFGKGLTLSPGHSYWWIPIHHFFHYNFYVFTYSFGELLALALYQKYKVQGKKFTSKYINMLHAGGSLPPVQLLQTIGVDITQPDFWTEGLDLIEKMVSDFEDLAKSK